jgi:hypothetical protein
MRKGIVVGLALVFALVAASVSFAEPVGGKISLKAGDEVYVCGCGETCPCQTMSRNPGKCTCGKDLVKVKVNKVEKGKAYVTIDGKERAFKTKGKYMCACGAGCKCDTISQSPGKCTCGKDMIKVEAKKKKKS